MLVLNTQTEVVRKALSGVKVCEAEDNDLYRTLSIIYLIVGLRPHHFPTKQEDTVILGFLREEYALKTLDELILAFKLAMKGELDLEDVKVYDQFTCEYLARVMTAYRKWLKEVDSKVIPAPPPAIENKEEVTPDEIIEIAKGCLKYDWRLIPVRAYTILYNQGKRNTEDQKEEIKKTIGLLLNDMEREDPGLYTGTTKADYELGLCKKLSVRNWLSS